MTDKVNLFVFSNDEVEAFLTENEIQLDTLLAQEGITVTSTHAANPATVSDSNTRDVTTVIFASATLVASLTPILSRTLSALMHKQVVIHVNELKPVEDSSGTVVRDTRGEPILHWVRTAKIVESKERSYTSADKIAVKGPIGLEIAFEDGNGGAN